MQIMKNSRNIVENLAAPAPFNIIDIILATGCHLDGKVGTWCDDGTTLIEKKKLQLWEASKTKLNVLEFVAFTFPPFCGTLLVNEEERFLCKQKA